MSVNISNNNVYNEMLGLVNRNNQPPITAEKIELPAYAPPAVKIEDAQKEEKSHKKHYIAGISIGSGLLLALFLVTGLSKGFSGNFYKKIQKYSADLARRTFELKANSKSLTRLQKVKLGFAKFMQPLTDTLEATSNFNVIKDGGTLQILKKIRMMPVVNKINTFFKNIVLKTKTGQYKKAEMSAVKISNYLEHIGQRDNEKVLEHFGKRISNNYFGHFSTQQHYKRSEDMWDALKGLHEKVWDSLFVGRKPALDKAHRKRFAGSYITMTMSEPERNAVLSSLKNYKTTLSNSVSDNHKALKEALNNLKVHVNGSDENAVKFVQEIEEQLSKYKKLSGKTEAADREVVSAKMKEILQNLQKHFNKESASSVNKELARFNDLLDPAKTKKGYVQEALTIVKNKYGKNSQEYKTVKQYAHELNKNMNKAISTEMTAYEKLAELQMGSAPTDIIGILFPASVGAGMVISAKDKDQRVTNALTKGIPILGGIGTAYYGTTRMFTGPTNMAFGLITGALLSIVGSKVDEVYKKSKAKKDAFKKEFEALKLAQSMAKETAKAQSEKQRQFKIALS